MLSPPDSPRGRLLEQYVRARIVSMEGIDVGLYEFDRHNAIYFFVVNAEEQIYLRYGGRDAASAMTYLDLDSLELALEEGLRQHERWKEGELPAPPRPAPLYPRDIPLLQEKEIAVGRCVECHMIGDYQAAAQERSGELDKPTTMFPSPDITELGIELDVPRGLVVGATGGPAAAAGLEPGDRIVSVEGHPVYTFGDLQYRLGKHPRNATQLQLSVARRADTATASDRSVPAPPLELTLELAPRWWLTDISYRYWSIDPQFHFTARPLEERERSELGLPADSLACRVTRVDPRARVLGTHELEEGDVILSIGGQRTSPQGESCELYLQLHVVAGNSIELEVLRHGERQAMRLATHRQYYRKSK